jgi:hypothetical protein
MARRGMLGGFMAAVRRRPYVVYIGYWKGRRGEIVHLAIGRAVWGQNTEPHRLLVVHCPVFRVQWILDLNEWDKYVYDRKVCV